MSHIADELRLVIGRNEYEKSLFKAAADLIDEQEKALVKAIQVIVQTEINRSRVPPPPPGPGPRSVTGSEPPYKTSIWY